MNPAPPVTRIRIRGSLEDKRADSVNRRRRVRTRPGGSRSRAGPPASAAAPGRRFSLRSTEYAGRGAGRPSSAVVIGVTRHSSFASSKIACANSAHVHSPARRDVPDPLRELDDRLRRLGQMPHVGRRADLVVDHRDLVPLARRGEASSARSCAPSGRRARTSGRSRPARRPPPRRRLRAAVGRQWVRRVRLDLRRALLPSKT